MRRLVPRSFLERGGIVSNWGGIAAPAVAEHALLLALMALRNQRAWSQIIHHPDITRPPAHRLGTRTLHGRAIGIHGFGQVARELVKLLQPFGVSIRAYTNGLPPDAIQSHGITPADSLAGLFSQSEILFECEALTPSTAGSVTAGILARLPDGAVFVNVGRGLVVDEQALLRESADGRLRVALDVVSREPMDSRTPFLCHDAPILSPHIGGPTDDIHRECTLKAFANIDRYLSGLAPESIITPEIYDRST